MEEIVSVDIGGTHARFALAQVANGRVLHLGEPVTLKTAEHGSFQLAWEHFGAIVGRPLPKALGMSIACPIDGEVLRLTNNPWIIRPALIPEKMHVDHYALVNDFGAVGHAVAHCPPEYFRHLCGPDEPISDARVVSVVGPGTGLGVGMVVRGPRGVDVVETEGGHIDFAPIDPLEDRILEFLRKRYRRVSAERVASGPGLVNLYQALGSIEGRAVQADDDKALWAAALEGSDSLAAAALDRFCLSLGGIAGDIALAQGAQAVVMAGGLGLRLVNHLPTSGFATRFVAKGRFEAKMAGMPVKLITHPQPGLLGAAIAYAQAAKRGFA
jgi:glucokinase